jgi:hypothetical protein
MLRICLLAPLGLVPLAHFAQAQPLDTLELATLQPGQTATQNALWGETRAVGHPPQGVHRERPAAAADPATGWQRRMIAKNGPSWRNGKA